MADLDLIWLNSAFILFNSSSAWSRSRFKATGSSFHSDDVADVGEDKDMGGMKPAAAICGEVCITDAGTMPGDCGAKAGEQPAPPLEADGVLGMLLGELGVLLK